MIYGYCRCSTNETKQDINRQKRELKMMGVDDNAIFLEYESATKLNRPELMKLLSIVKSGDTIVSTEVSRITRSTKQLIDVIELVKEKQLKLVIKDSITIDCTDSKQIDAMTNAFIQISAVFAELERNMIVDRVRSGMSNARAKGVRLGRPALTVDKIPSKVLNLYDRYRDKQLSKTEYAKICEISRPTLDKYISLMTDK
ncbi:recombinase family protein [Ruminococcus flavefaciens]|uniref:recombinase family protein n=1 Tax=Ruminococcus flavefaciens TaxID=1265 RepID=UPI0026EC42F8|nr:recombinase family protein [Ruminococcus flavefaciens]